MTGFAAIAGLLLAAAPTPERVVVLPFEPLAIDPAKALEGEKAVRQSLQKIPRVELVDASRLRDLLASDASLRDCVETRCLATIATRLDAHSVVSGVVAGLGDFKSMVIKRTDRDGKLVTSVSDTLANEALKIPELVCAAMGRGVNCHQEAAQPTLIAPPPPSLAAAPSDSGGLRATRKAALGVGAAALVAFGAAAGFGVSANALSGQVEHKELTCTGATQAECLAGKLSTGRTHATVSNVLWGVGGAMAAAAVVLFVLPESKPAVALGPGPAPVGVSVHARF